MCLCCRRHRHQRSNRQFIFAPRYLMSICLCCICRWSARLFSLYMRCNCFSSDYLQICQNQLLYDLLAIMWLLAIENYLFDVTRTAYTHNTNRSMLNGFDTNTHTHKTFVTQILMNDMTRCLKHFNHSASLSSLAGINMRTVEVGSSIYAHPHTQTQTDWDKIAKHSIAYRCATVATLIYLISKYKCNFLRKNDIYFMHTLASPKEIPHIVINRHHHHHTHTIRHVRVLVRVCVYLTCMQCIVCMFPNPFPTYILK